MHDRIREPAAEKTSRQAVHKAERQPREQETIENVSPQRGLLARMVFRPGAASAARAHASVLNRAATYNSSRAVDSLLQLQRTFGNRHVERVVGLMREAQGDEHAAPDVEVAIQRARGGGQALDSGARALMEPAFDADFSQVRVHTDGEADALTRAVNARAFTTSADIFFRGGEYSPSSPAGRELLAHELTHVVQQGAGIRRKLTISQPEDIYEREADQAARAIMHIEADARSEEPVAHDQSAGVRVQRACAPCEDREAEERIGRSTNRAGDHTLFRKLRTSPEERMDRQTAVGSRDQPVLGGAISAVAAASPVVWEQLPTALKAVVVDNLLDYASLHVDEFPGKEGLGGLWIFVREGLVGFYAQLRSAKAEVKIPVVDKIIRIMSGRSPEYAKGVLIGFLKGFFLDGLLGIFIAIWDLIKGLPQVWHFIKSVGELIGGLPDDIAELLASIQAIVDQSGSTIDPVREITKLISDPERVRELVTMIVMQGISAAKSAGSKIAQSLLDFFSREGAEKEVGEAYGRIAGMIIFEVVFAIVTEGGGTAVTGLKSVAKYVAKLGGKIAGSVLKVFRELTEMFDVVVDALRGAVRFLREEVLAKVGKQLGEIFEKLKGIFAKFLKYCHETSLVCNLPARIKDVIAEVEVLVEQGIPGAEKLRNLLQRSKPWFREGFVFQAQRAVEYAKRGQLVAIEKVEVIAGKVARFDMVIKDFARVSNTGEFVEVILETKNWTGLMKLDEITRETRLASLVDQMDKYMKSGMPVLLEWKGPIPGEVMQALKSLLERGLRVSSI